MCSSDLSGDARVADDPDLDTDTLRLLHRTIAGVSEDYAALRNNTAVAKLIEYTNHLTKQHRDTVPRAAVQPLVLMLAPLAPHIAEELWAKLGHEGSLAYEPFPQADPALVTEPEVRLAVQVDGKTRLILPVPASADQAEIERLLAEAGVAGLTGGKPVRRTVIVPGRIVNIVTR